MTPPLVTIRSGSDASIRYRIEAANSYLGARAAALGDLDGDGRGELLISAYEADVDGVECAGAVYVLSFRGE